jgi:hypothetical protein
MILLGSVVSFVSLEGRGISFECSRLGEFANISPGNFIFSTYGLNFHMPMVPLTS